MRSLLLWFLILGVLCFLMLTPPPTASSSSLAQRRTTGNSTAGPSLEQERSGLREAERQRQAALQETPSRRRRRIPGQAQNREPSPTPTTTSQTIRLGLGTPPETQAPTQNAPSRAALAQCARREHEAAAKAVAAELSGVENMPPPRATAPRVPAARRSAGQQARRRGEHENRAIIRLPTPPPTRHEPGERLPLPPRRAAGRRQPPRVRGMQTIPVDDIVY
ncbi:hypothetical protein B0H11DRAFT_1916092 [Mycena galericulata]|nr:hypothetical protein B0H11DRAFT_1916092 [Mycena galericulata]